MEVTLGLAPLMFCGRRVVEVGEQTGRCLLACQYQTEMLRRRSFCSSPTLKKQDQNFTIRNNGLISDVSARITPTLEEWSFSAGGRSQESLPLIHVLPHIGIRELSNKF
jgi:hypothetical protein